MLVEGGSLFGSLADLAKTTVEQIIAYFAKLAVINPILNYVFGGQPGFQLLPEMANAFGGQTALAQTGSAVTSATSGGAFDFMSMSSWINAGKNLWSGFSNAWSNFQTGFGIGNGTDTMVQNNLAQMPGYYSTNGGFLGDAYGGSSLG